MFGKDVIRRMGEFRASGKPLRPCEFVDQDIVCAISGEQGQVEDKDELIQQENACERLGSMVLYETFYKITDCMPYMYMGKCEPGDKINRSPAIAVRTFIISQFHVDDAGQLEFNIDFAKALAWITYCNGEFPIVPHLYLPQFLSDEGNEREWGIQAGHQLMASCDRVFMAVVHGHVSSGMRRDIDFANLELGLPVSMQTYSIDEAAALIRKFKESRA